ncbi:MAG TPA: tyrosine-type recombinase/integrase [Jatrophihabitantaceae bacterium]|jgi:integrase
MASVEKRTRNGQTRWYARYRDPAGEPRAKVFDRKIDADRFLTKIEAAKLVGGYVDPKQAARTFRDVAEEHWAAHKHNLAEDTTRPRKRSVLDKHILPTIGRYPVGAIKPSTVSAAVATWSKTLAPGTVGQVLRQVRQILDAALADGIVSTNVAKAVRPPSPPRRRDVHLSDDDVKAIIAATPERYWALVVALVGLGLRISEACGLLVSDVDFLRKTVHVRRQRRPRGELGRLKTASSGRDVPADDSVLAALSEQIRRWPREDGLVFSSITGRALTKAIAGHLFDDIAETTGIAVSPHSCRHYFGSSLISRGVSVVAVSRWLGHSSPEITWRVYSYMMANDDEVGRAAMAATMGSLLAGVYPSCTREQPKVSDARDSGA